MRLRRLQIDRHLLLRDLDLRFDRPGRLDTGQYALDFLVGVNGSGKSTVLRALAQIVSDLRTDRATDFNYTLEYELQGRDGPYLIVVTQQPSDTGPRKHMTVRSRAMPDDPPVYTADAIDQTYLPNYVVIYTTGSETEWEEALARTYDTLSALRAEESSLTDPVQRTVAELPGHLPSIEVAEESSAERSPYLLVRASRLPIVTFCGLLAHLAASSEAAQRPLKDVLASLGISYLRGFSLRFRLHAALSSRETFERIRPFATRYVRQGTDHLLVFDLSVDDFTIPTELLQALNGSLNLFEELDRLQDLSPSGEATLQQVNLFFERPGPPTNEEAAESGETVSRLFLLDWLSDGEQSFLGRMALLAMLDTEDSLILLDEPEVHFNDYWKRETVNLLDMIMQAHSNHLLITTHSSIVLSDVTESQVIVLVRGSDGWARRHFLRIPLLAVDPSEIMVNWFGTERSVGERSTRLLNEAVERGDREELQRLLGLVGPGYWRYRIQDRLEELRAASR